MLSKIRWMFLRDKLSLHEIAKRTDRSRNTVRKWLAPQSATSGSTRRISSRDSQVSIDPRTLAVFDSRSRLPAREFAAGAR